mmetsp:Transcript_126859/g.364871  ORF Transcript_126859/g.364871 Transcript_126859/m.364871 type:complete len:569 (-) Transcript_126859:115-1821(-)
MLSPSMQWIERDAVGPRHPPPLYGGGPDPRLSPDRKPRDAGKSAPRPLELLKELQELRAAKQQFEAQREADAREMAEALEQERRQSAALRGRMQELALELQSMRRQLGAMHPAPAPGTAGAEQDGETLALVESLRSELAAAEVARVRAEVRAMRFEEALARCQNAGCSPPDDLSTRPPTADYGWSPTPAPSADPASFRGGRFAHGLEGVDEHAPIGFPTSAPPTLRRPNTAPTRAGRTPRMSMGHLLYPQSQSARRPHSAMAASGRQPVESGGDGPEFAFRQAAASSGVGVPTEARSARASLPATPSRAVRDVRDDQAAARRGSPSVDSPRSGGLRAASPHMGSLLAGGSSLVESTGGGRSPRRAQPSTSPVFSPETSVVAPGSDRGAGGDGRGGARYISLAPPLQQQTHSTARTGNADTFNRAVSGASAFFAESMQKGVSGASAFFADTLSKGVSGAPAHLGDMSYMSAQRTTTKDNTGGRRRSSLPCFASSEEQMNMVQSMRDLSDWRKVLSGTRDRMRKERHERDKRLLQIVFGPDVPGQTAENEDFFQLDGERPQPLRRKTSGL